MNRLSIELERARIRALVRLDRVEEAREALAALDEPWADEMALRLAVLEGRLEEELPRCDRLPADRGSMYRALAAGAGTVEGGDDPYARLVAGLLGSREDLEAFLADPHDPWVAAALPPEAECDLARSHLPAGCPLCGAEGPAAVCEECSRVLEDPAALDEVRARAAEDEAAAAWLVRARVDAPETAGEEDVGWPDPNVYAERDVDGLLDLLGGDACVVVGDAGDPLTLGALVGAIRRHPMQRRAVAMEFMDALSEEAASDVAADEASATPQSWWALHLAGWLAGLDVFAQGRVRLRHLAAGVGWACVTANPQARSLWPWLAAEAHGLVVYYPSVAQRADLDALLAERPSDAFLRLVKLCWARRDVEGGAPRGPFVEGVLWMLEHHPWLMLPVLTLLRPEEDPSGYLGAVEGWTRALASEDPVVLERAAGFFTLPEPRVSEAAYLRLQEAQPEEAEWHRWLSHLYALHRQGTPAARRARVEKALEEAEKAALMAPDSELRYYAGQAVELALEADDVERAERWAASLLESVASGPQGPRDWNYGNVIHKANLVLGRVALRKGDREEAVRRLLEAGKTPGSPQLDSFGPNMQLAAELLELGERDNVLRYMELCSAFWGMGHGRLIEWARCIQEGRPVNFGANLNY